MTTKVLPATLTIRATGTAPEVVITTPTVDYMGDTIDPMGMDVTRYMGGPRAVNFAHDHSRLPVGQTVSLAKSERGIRAKFRWLDHPDAQQVRPVFEEGVLGASVEFVPVESARLQNGGYHYLQTVLTGWALTSNPANVECMRVTKGLGLLDAVARTPRGSSVDLDLAAIPFDPAEVARLTKAPPGGDVLVLDDEDVCAGLSAAEVAGLIRQVIVTETAAGMRRVVNSALGRVD